MPFAVIMAGGRGERLWPLSTPERPKQFLKLGTRQTMLQETVTRISPLIPRENIYVITPKEFAKLALEQLDIPQENIIVEPIGRSTAPCIGLAAIKLEAKDPKSVMIVLTSDHVIKKRRRFLEILKGAIEVASSGTYLVTLGIVPNYPSSGYGYIRRGELFTKVGDIEVYKVQSFSEKPDKETARRFLEQGDYFWNSGIFIWRVDVILAAIQRYMPKLYSGLMEIKKHLEKRDLDAVITRVYQEQESISIDYGIMERAPNILMIPADIGWTDVGDWSALDLLFDKDQDGNIVQASHVVMIDTKNCIIFDSKSSEERIIATIGIENIIIVITERALLVINKERAQDVKKIVDRIRCKGGV